MWRVARSAVSSLRQSRRRLLSTAIPGPCIVHKRGSDILHDPWFNKVLIDNIKDFAPIIYTPTVGLVCQNYSGLFRRPRGMYFSAKDKGEMMSMIYNWPSQQVDMIVLTDGSRILGLGDLGVQGIGIPIGKLDIYVAAAGINPQRILPVMLDVVQTIRSFLKIAFFEDFQMKWAFETLERYRKRFCMFNDDIQGTAGVALAGLLGTVRAQGLALTDFANQKIVVVGAGSAGLGVLKMALQAVSRMSGSASESHFFLLDKDGLITKERKCLDPAAAPFAKSQGEIEGLGLSEGSSLTEVVKKVKPHVLLGLSGVGGIFNEEVLKAMRESDSSKPAIFAMSNPTTNAECTAAEAFKHAGENIVFASGSPFENVDLGNGKLGHVNQANNMYLFPGIGLGSLLSGARIITDEMMQAAARCLASYMTDEEIQRGVLYPSIDCIRDITAEVGAAVLRAAVAEEVAEGHGDVGPRELSHMSKDETVRYVKDNMWRVTFIWDDSCEISMVAEPAIPMAEASSKAIKQRLLYLLSSFQFGKLDILVNNAGITGAIFHVEKIEAVRPFIREANVNWDYLVTQTYEAAVEGLQTNYYGLKRLSEALLPLLRLSDSPRIVNVSSASGKLKDGNLYVEGQPGVLAAYTISKAAMNAYTRILAKKYPGFRINSVCPGYVKTDINCNTGILAVEEGAESVVSLPCWPLMARLDCSLSEMKCHLWRNENVKL
ncbi:UNVERIFIED_CONTAM: NAD-dependent malic enzyme isoform, mitochondrial [Sesamum radiatum]|uniref:Malic enzyme n=1 Tax=Sesamum radiatum TaxID=300843 RepID=A0AAW2V9L2_SESRA